MTFARIATGAAAIAVALWAQTSMAVAAASSSENTPVNLAPSGGAAGSGAGGGGGIARTIVGLLIVVAAIWGLSWVLRKVKSSREEQAMGTGLTSVSSMPLGAGRSVHVVRAGREVLLLGVSEQQVTRLGSWSQAEAEAMGLLEPPEDIADLLDTARRSPGPGDSAPAFARVFVESLRERTLRR